MKNLVRGGLILSLIGTFVVFIYAQTKTEYVPVIATDSQLQFNTVINSNKVLEGTIKADITQDPLVKDQKKSKESDSTTDIDPAIANESGNEKKLVEKTVSSRAVGANRGSFVATAYCLRGRTASGAMVRKGIVAADPRVLRLGTKLNLGAGGHSGSYVVADTGGKIKGKRLDIWMASCADARRFGRRTVTVNVP
jgi:3D (Asp-Asp-Asp) domain-containing protein